MNSHYNFGGGYVWCDITSSIGLLTNLVCDKCRAKVYHLNLAPRKFKIRPDVGKITLKK